MKKKVKKHGSVIYSEAVESNMRKLKDGMISFGKQEN